jgi:hypothetical protein
MSYTVRSPPINNSLSFLRSPAPLPPSNMSSVYHTGRRSSTARQTQIRQNNNNNEALFGVVSSTGTVLPYNSRKGTFRNRTPPRLKYTSNPCNETNTNNEYLFGRQMQNKSIQKYNNSGKPCPPKNNHRIGQQFSLPPPPLQFRGTTVKKSIYPSECANNLILDEGNPMNSVNSYNEYHTNNTGISNLWRSTNQGWKCKKDIFGATREYLNQRKKPTWRQKLKQTLKNFKQTIGNKFITIKKKKNII